MLAASLIRLLRSRWLACSPTKALYLAQFAVVVNRKRIGFSNVRVVSISSDCRSEHRIFAFDEQQRGDLLGVELFAGIRRHDANKSTTFAANTTNRLSQIRGGPGTPLVPSGGGYVRRYPLLDAESHNAVDGQAPPHGRYLSTWDRGVHQTPKCEKAHTDGGSVRRR